MSTRVSRRDALKQLGAAGAAAAFAPRLLFQTGAITVGGRPVEVSVISLGRTTLRLLVTPLLDGNPTPLPVDGALVSEFPGQSKPFRSAVPSVQAGDLTVRFTADPPTFQVSTAKGTAVQTLTLSAT